MLCPKAVAVRAGAGQEVASGRLIEGVAELMARELAERLEQRDVEVATDDGGRDQHPLSGLAQSLEPAAR